MANFFSNLFKKNDASVLGIDIGARNCFRKNRRILMRFIVEIKIKDLKEWVDFFSTI
jgi:hypothetical protein